MTTYLVTIETRQRGAIGAFQKTTYEYHCNGYSSRTHAFEYVFTLARASKLETRFGISIVEKASS